jgi:hypothetical protein
LTLREKQSLFVELTGQWVAWVYGQGYQLTVAEAYRPPDVAEIYAAQGRGIKSSLHCSRLAIDWNLFIDGKYITSTEGHRPLGEKWESMHELTRWGGRFKRRDGNHYSLTHGGRA